MYQSRTQRANSYFYNMRRFHNNVKRQLYDKYTKNIDKLLDLACGKGRHSIFLNKKGYNVLGADLSEKSIFEAKKSENESLIFLVNDMRDELNGHSFNYIFIAFWCFITIGRCWY